MHSNPVSQLEAIVLKSVNKRIRMYGCFSLIVFFFFFFWLLGTLKLNHGENIHWKLGIRDNIR